MHILSLTCTSWVRNQYTSLAHSLLSKSLYQNSLLIKSISEMITLASYLVAKGLNMFSTIRGDLFVRTVLSHHYNPSAHITLSALALFEYKGSMYARGAHDPTYKARTPPVPLQWREAQAGFTQDVCDCHPTHPSRGHEP